METMKDAEYRIIFFPGVVKYTGLAWNYDDGIMLTTPPCDSYSEAKVALANVCNRHSVRLRWFDGEWHYDKASGQLLERNMH